MMMSGVLIATLGGAIGGALGAVIGFALGRVAPAKWRRGIEIGCAVLFAAIGGKLAPMLAGPSQHAPANIERDLLADAQFGELAGAWRAADPASFNAFITRISQAGAGTDRAILIEQGRAELRAAAIPRLGYLDDASLVEMLRLSRDQMLELRTRHPVACHPLFHNRGFGDISPYVSPDTQARERDLAVAAFRADANTPRVTLEGDALNGVIDVVVEQTRADFGEDIALIAPDANVEGREARACEAIAALYDHVQRLPEAQAAALMRGLLAGALGAHVRQHFAGEQLQRLWAGAVVEEEREMGDAACDLFVDARNDLVRRADIAAGLPGPSLQNRSAFSLPRLRLRVVLLPRPPSLLLR